MIYFDWLISAIFSECPEAPWDFSRNSYQKLLRFLFYKRYYWSVNNDVNRASDGEELRRLYENETGNVCEKYGSCSVLEMMVALAMRCEDDIMHDDDYGDRTYIWFWEMIINLGLDEYDDYSYDEQEIGRIVDRFLSRRYGRDGRNGPFYIPGFEGDLRKIELWYQINYYVQEKFME